ncbi:unnamed protein product [Dracunculus medinensis]|uniref:Uncharacterized protein n=1 Tax=Dracunculus medinensis TaxID=318479 RepID=A0A158Q5N1_DRAME|nr:unnamed protein product [Dracunculus medinensis]
MKKFRILLERIPEINTSKKPGNIFVAFNGELELELAFYGRKNIYIYIIKRMDWIWSWSDFVFYGFCSCSGNNKTTDKTTDFTNKQSESNCKLYVVNENCINFDKNINCLYNFNDMNKSQDFLSLLEKLQSERLDDQRCEMFSLSKVIFYFFKYDYWHYWQLSHLFSESIWSFRGVSQNKMKGNETLKIQETVKDVLYQTRNNGRASQNLFVLRPETSYTSWIQFTRLGTPCSEPLPLKKEEKEKN